MHAKRTLFGVGLLLILTIWLSGCADQRAPISTVLQNCLTIERIPDPERQLQAPLLLRVNVDIYSVDPRSGQTSLLLGSKTLLKLIDDLYVSPDYRRFVYTEMLYFVKPKTVGERQTHRRIVLVQSNGQEREVYRSPIYPGWLLGWLDNERLILARSDLAFGAVTLLNPLTGQREDVLPTFSHFYPPLFYDPETGRAAYFLDPPRWFPIAYSPDTSRALLYLYDGSHPARDILWDTERQQIVWEEETSVRIGLRPQWSPDGRSVLVAMPYDREDDNNYGQELYTIDRNGRAVQLTNVSMGYPNYTFFASSWSPDSRRLAYWVITGQDQPQPRLSVLDLDTRRITDYCIGPPGRDTLSWSPDSSQLAVMVRSDSLRGTVIVDVENQRAFLLAENAQPLGWWLSDR